MSQPMTEQEMKAACDKYNCMPHQVMDYVKQEANKKTGKTLCGHCDGTGNEFYFKYHVCPDCGGTGIIQGEKLSPPLSPPKSQ